MNADLEFLKTLTILYIEDDDNIFGVTVQLLSRYCATLLTARNGREGLEVFQKHSPDMIISDIMMPVMDGLSMVKEIRKTSRSVPIILLTAFESVDYLMSAINANVDKYLVKPFRINALLESLLSCAHHVRVERELEQSEEGLRQMFQLSADAHFRMEDDVITDCNKAAEKMIGYKKQQMCGLSVKALMPEHQPDGTSTLNSYREHVDHVMAGGDTPRELLLQSPSRGLFWAEISGSTFRLHGKQMFQWNIRDVTIRKESEEKLVSITNSASDAILTMDSKGNILFWNPAATTIFGYTPQEVIGENLHNLLAPPRYHADHQAAFPRFMETGQGNAVNKTVELSALRKDGQEIPIELSLSSHQHGTEWHAIGIIRDISVRKRAEAEAQSLNEKLRMATEAASTLDGLAVQICVLNQNGSIVRTNLQWDRFSREHGDCQLKHCAGKTYFSGCSAASEVSSPSTDELSQEIRSVLDGTLTEFTTDYFCCPNGDQFWFSCKVTPFVANGNNYVIIANIDISARKAHELELLKLSRAIEQSPVSVVIANSMGIIEYVNPYTTELTGYSSAELIGKNPRVLKSEFTPRETFVDVWSTITAGNSWEGEFINVRKDGTLLNEHAKISPIRNDQGVTTHYVAIKEDITRRKEMEKALITAKELAEAGSKAKSEFLATISHEMRTPLNGVLGMLQVLQDTVLTGEQLEFTEIARKSGDHLLDVINDIFDYADIQKFSFSISNVDFDIRDVLSNAIPLHRIIAEEKGLILLDSISPEIPSRLNGDPKRLCQVVANLLSNAIKFTDKGKIHFAVRVISYHQGVILLHFDVADSGIGIPKEHHIKIFEPFTQGDGSMTRRYEGTGMGLAISKQIVHLCGGDIGVKSDVGTGSSFWFTMTLGVPEVDAPIMTTSDIRSGGVADTTPVEGHEIQVLYAEDNIINQKVVINLLTKLGYKTDIVENGAAAVVALEKRNYDLVLMDCLMPIMDGLDATKIIRDTSSHVLNHEVPIIAVTANVLDNDRESCLSAGMDDYLTKPLKKDTLASTILTWITKKRR